MFSIGFVASFQCGALIEINRGPESEVAAAWDTSVSKFPARTQLGTIVFSASQNSSGTGSSAAWHSSGAWYSARDTVYSAARHSSGAWYSAFHSELRLNGSKAREFR